LTPSLSSPGRLSPTSLGTLLLPPLTLDLLVSEMDHASGRSSDANTRHDLGAIRRIKISVAMLPAFAAFRRNNVLDAKRAILGVLAVATVIAKPHHAQMVDNIEDSGDKGRDETVKKCVISAAYQGSAIDAIAYVLKFYSEY